MSVSSWRDKHVSLGSPLTPLDPCPFTRRNIASIWSSEPHRSSSRCAASEGISRCLGSFLLPRCDVFLLGTDWTMLVQSHPHGGRLFACCRCFFFAGRPVWWLEQRIDLSYLSKGVAKWHKTIQVTFCELQHHKIPRRHDQKFTHLSRIWPWNFADMSGDKWHGVLWHKITGQTDGCLGSTVSNIYIYMHKNGSSVCFSDFSRSHQLQSICISTFIGSWKPAGIQKRTNHIMHPAVSDFLFGAQREMYLPSRV